MEPSHPARDVRSVEWIAPTLSSAQIKFGNLAAIILATHQQAQMAVGYTRWAILQETRKGACPERLMRILAHFQDVRGPSIVTVIALSTSVVTSLRIACLMVVRSARCGSGFQRIFDDI